MPTLYILRMIHCISLKVPRYTDLFGKIKEVVPRLIKIHYRYTKFIRNKLARQQQSAGIFNFLF